MPKLADRAWLVRRYVREGAGLGELAEELACTLEGVRQALIAGELAAPSKRHDMGFTAPSLPVADRSGALTDAGWPSSEAVVVSKTLPP